MAQRSIETWKRIGEENADADRRRNIHAGQTVDEVRHALTYHHCDDLDSAEITGDGYEARQAAIDALVTGYLSTLPLATPADPPNVAVFAAQLVTVERMVRGFPDLTFRGAADRIAGFCAPMGVVFSCGGVAEGQAIEAYRKAWGDGYRWAP